MQNINDESNIEFEKEVNSTKDLNEFLLLNNGFVIALLNIRSLNSNFDILETFLEILKVKPHIIVLSETWNVCPLGLFNIEGYLIYYNESHLNKSDCVVLYVMNSLNHNTVIDQIGDLSLISTTVSGLNNFKLKVTGLYRCHDLKKEEFIKSVKIFLDRNKNFVVILILI